MLMSDIVCGRGRGRAVEENKGGNQAEQVALCKNLKLGLAVT